MSNNQQPTCGDADLPFDEHCNQHKLILLLKATLPIGEPCGREGCNCLMKDINMDHVPEHKLIMKLSENIHTIMERMEKLEEISKGAAQFLAIEIKKVEKLKKRSDTVEGWWKKKIDENKKLLNKMQSLWKMTKVDDTHTKIERGDVMDYVVPHQVVDKIVAEKNKHFQQLLNTRKNFNILLDLIKTCDTPEKLEKLKDMPLFEE